MAGLLGRTEDRGHWLDKANATAALVRAALWDDTVGVFFDRLPQSKGGDFVRVTTPATFWTLLAGIATPTQAARMALLLTNASQLGSQYPMPCVGVKEPMFNPTDYWRGPTVGGERGHNLKSIYKTSGWERELLAYSQPPSPN